VRLGDLITEAWRNTRLGASRALLAVAVLGPVVLALAWLDMSQVAAVQREASTYRQAGAATYVITSDGQVDGARCDALARVAGVRAAGALRTAGAPFVPTATPANAIPQYDITPGLAHQLDPDYTTGVALDAATAQGLGITPGELLHGTGGNAAVVATYDYPADGRDQTLSYALTRSGPPTGTYDQCWLALWPPDPTTAGTLLTTTLTPGADLSQTRTGQLNPTLGASFDAPQRFATRTGRYAAPAALLFALAIVIGIARLRRLELAYARHLGLSRLHITALLTLETTIVALPTAAIGAAATNIYATTTHLDQLWPFGLRVLALAVLGAIAGAILAGTTTTQKRLFQYFKTR
jgi:hypothetical protein